MGCITVPPYQPFEVGWVRKQTSPKSQKCRFIVALCNNWVLKIWHILSLSPPPYQGGAILSFSYPFKGKLMFTQQLLIYLLQDHLVLLYSHTLYQSSQTVSYIPHLRRSRENWGGVKNPLVVCGYKKSPPFANFCVIVLIISVHFDIWIFRGGINIKITLKGSVRAKRLGALPFIDKNQTACMIQKTFI